jgi:hypothetical protein
MIAQAQPIQPFPKSGMLADNTNLDTGALRQKLRGQGSVVHCYVVRTIEYPQGEFIQTGSGPNFQGDLITLCTCKHQMWSRRSVRDWRGAWVAGFTSVGKVPGDHVNHLVYLMKVGQAFASHRDLWAALSPTERDAKVADKNPLGDVFQPRAPVGDSFDPRSYVPPGPDHSHCPGNLWQEDIDDHRRPPLLVGDRDFSFLWSRPLVAWPKSRIARDYERHGISDFLDRLA